MLEVPVAERGQEPSSPKASGGSLALLTPWFQPPELWGSALLTFLATQFMVTCYISSRKWKTPFLTCITSASQLPSWSPVLASLVHPACLIFRNSSAWVWNLFERYERPDYSLVLPPTSAAIVSVSNNHSSDNDHSAECFVVLRAL